MGVRSRLYMGMHNLHTYIHTYICGMWQHAWPRHMTEMRSRGYVPYNHSLYHSASSSSSSSSS